MLARAGCSCTQRGAADAEGAPAGTAPAACGELEARVTVTGGAWGGAERSGDRGRQQQRAQQGRHARRDDPAR